MNRIQTYISGEPFVDHVYAEGNLVRVDKSAKQMRTHLDELPFDTSKAIWAGVTNPYKHPYKYPSMSVYIAGNPPIDVPHLGWYGIKYDYGNSDILYKIQDIETVNPFSSITAQCSAKTFTASGEELPYYDYYLESTVEEMRAFCEEHSLAFPCEDTTNIWYWGVTTHGSLPMVVKAYRAME